VGQFEWETSRLSPRFFMSPGERFAAPARITGSKMPDFQGFAGSGSLSNLFPQAPAKN
jgi:hypothetical protein